jgi:hypothetical protein
MDTHQITIILLSFIVAGGLVLASAYMVIKKFFDNSERRRYYELKANNQRITLPIRLQAYERLTLLLERMSLNNLILRVKQNGMIAADLQVSLQAEIRAEFEHNLSQQLYISAEAWQLIVNAKENTARIINMSFGKLPSGASALDLSKTIFEFTINEESQPTSLALNYLKKEARELF